ncbi:MAG: MCE family protein [Deltaproteobacteria bacterium]|nr:MCE family protein [Deltaproteobacteria bacterium]
MNRQASKTLIGAFVVGAVILIVAGVLIFGSGKLMKKTGNCVLFFKGSLQGLNVGSPVLFRGVKIGSVKSIVIETDVRDLTFYIPVIIEIDLNAIHVKHGEREEEFGKNLPILIKQGLRAQLAMGSLVTGQLVIELNFHPKTPVELMDLDKEYPEIPTIPSAFEQISDMLNKLPLGDIIDKLMSAVEALEKFLSSSEIPEIMRALKLAVEDTRKLIQNLDSRIEPLAMRIDETAHEYGKLARHVDDKVDPLISDVQSTLKETRKLVSDTDAQVKPLVDSLEKSLRKAREALEQGRKTLASAEGTIGKDSPLVYQMDNTLKEISSMARSVRSFADYLERHPDALLYGKGKPKRR